MLSMTIEELPYTENSCKLYEKIRHLGNSVFLDSAQPFSKSGRYDIISAAPLKVYKYEPSNSKITAKEYYAILRNGLLQLGAIKNTENLPFIGGYLGYFGYEFNHDSHKLAYKTKLQQQSPLAINGLYSWAIINDHQDKITRLAIHPDTPPELQSALNKILLKAGSAPPKQSFELIQPFAPELSRADYQKAFNRCQTYISDGDCYQINLTQRFISYYQGDSWQAYTACREITAAPFSAFIEFEQANILSFSPERFLHIDDNTLSTSPIKGTAPRGNTEEEDLQLKNELLRSEKNQAENLMIVDLLRNDLGRNCLPGSINANRLFELQSFNTVHHLVSTITGQLKPHHDSFEVLRTSFPGGSITGAPKRRAMEIIDELEAAPRSIYCGSIGYISLDQKMDTNIAIRTLECLDGTIYGWAGGGIVADSNCESEYQECFAKIGKILTFLESIKGTSN